ncbi:TAXI family TRAP transporter solute-binding subunit [Roseimaritima ulvae]|uniref:NMT1/THI5 like protein n=1 Tax=Roseimaritima ulvae TaxID=980254 RepID=A0A5B9QUV7_9BACT|nr:TAXI family TRAP transporter solute-binding subunit [Roseimaritima ulvae]QEG41135.1 NMT1/THI5 like protein [Roseimaritima ulvae]
MSFPKNSLLTEHFRETRRQVRGLVLKIWGGGFLLVLIGFALAWFYIQPAPPRTIVIATGVEEGAYFDFASSYADYLREQGVVLELRTTAGSLENYRLLQTDPEVNLAVVQGGSAPDAIRRAGNIEALASLYFEPVWVFYRGDETLADLRELSDMRIAVGLAGSGTESIARLLLEENGIDQAGAKVVHAGGADAARQLLQGQVDAAVFVMSPQADIIRQLIGSPGIRLLDFGRHAAYAHRHPFLTSVTLKRGVIDLQRDYPSKDVHLIAPAANLVATAELHDALIPLLLRAASETHRRDGSLLQHGRLPSTEFIEFPLNGSAQRYFENGPPFLQKYLPFWIASAVDRGKILLLPAITLLFPLLRVAPPLYRWRIRSRIYRWYEILRGIESDLRAPEDAEVLQKHAETLATMEGELDDVRSVPLAYMQEFYNLRLHVEFVERRLKRVVESEDFG